MDYLSERLDLLETIGDLLTSIVFVFILLFAIKNFFSRFIANYPKLLTSTNSRAKLKK